MLSNMIIRKLQKFRFITVVSIVFFLSNICVVKAESLEFGGIYANYMHLSAITQYNGDAYFTGVNQSLSLDLLRINTKDRVFEKVMTLRDGVTQHDEAPLIVYKSKLYTVKLIKKDKERYIKTTTIDEDGYISSELFATSMPGYGHRSIKSIFQYQDDLYILVAAPVPDSSKFIDKDSYIYRFNGVSWEHAYTLNNESIVYGGTIGDRIYIAASHDGHGRVYNSNNGNSYSKTNSHIIGHLWEKATLSGDDYVINGRRYIARIKDDRQQIVLRKKHLFEYPLVSNNSMLFFQFRDRRHIGLTTDGLTYYKADFSSVTEPGETWNFFSVEDYGDAVGATFYRNHGTDTDYEVLLTDGVHWYVQSSNNWFPPHLFVRDGVVYDYGYGAWSLLTDAKTVGPEITLMSN